VLEILLVNEYFEESFKREVFSEAISENTGTDTGPWKKEEGKGREGAGWIEIYPHESKIKDERPSREDSIFRTKR
jgi:hypothetical protein